MYDFRALLILNRADGIENTKRNQYTECFYLNCVSYVHYISILVKCTHFFQYFISRSKFNFNSFRKKESC